MTIISKKQKCSLGHWHDGPESVAKCNGCGKEVSVKEHSRSWASVLVSEPYTDSVGVDACSLKCLIKAVRCYSASVRKSRQLSLIEATHNHEITIDAPLSFMDSTDE